MERPSGRMPDHEFKKLGEGTDSYIRVEFAGKLKKEFPTMVDVPDDTKLYVVTDAAGDAIFVTDSEDGALGLAASKGYRVWRPN